MSAVAATDPRATPAIEVRRVETPSGGGALQGMGESFAANEFSGAASLSIPLPASTARDLTPELSLDYSSFSGNGVFGMGFALGLGPVGRRTSQGVPRYRDDETFVLDGEVLVPRDGRVEEVGDAVWEVTRYRPRAEGGFDRIERWRDAASGDTHWRVTTTESVTTLYGRTPAARVADPGDESRVFEWWPELTWDPRGNAVRHEYKRENTENVPDAIWERGRVQTANRYPERVRYGNVLPFAEGDDLAAAEWMFEIVFDYGEYDVDPSNDDPYLPVRPWPARPDAFSSYDAGFERRTHRLCRNVLLFHRFAEIAAVPVLVQRMGFTYDERPELSTLVAAELTGSRYRASAPAGERYTVASLPALRLSFTPFVPGGGEWRPLRAAGGGDLAGAAIEPATTILDLYGDGIPGLFYGHDATVRYARPALAADGAVEYAAEAPRPFPLARTPEGAVALADLDGNGRLSVMVAEPGRAGYHPGEQGRFGAFVPFERYPSAIAPWQQHADLTGDGRPDLVVVEPSAVRVSPSLGTGGYAAVTPAPRQPGLPVSTADSGVEMLGFGNVLGIGGESRVRVRDGVVECWPSLGYGRFGEGVVLGGAPRFATFDPARVRLVDVDGSGTADLAYVYPDRVEIHRNLSGNAFAPDPIVVALPASALSPSQVSFADVDGSGCPSLVFAELTTPARQWSHPLAGAGKPYLLAEARNGLGGRTSVRYRSSARYQLEDRRDGRPWITTLPFPVQLVAEVEVEDPVSQAVSRAAYRYHHGWYDPIEREYRGFGMVERWDADLATADAPPGGPEVLAPSLTRSWFVTGAWEEEEALAAAYARESWSGDPLAYPMPPAVFEWLAPPTPAAERQARAALAGSPLRTEVFGVDGGPRASVPYTVTQQGYAVRELQPIGESRYGVFLATERETIVQSYEREAADPRTRHELALRYDAFANVERTATVSYRRRPGAPGTIEPQERTWITCDLAAYVPPRDEPAVYLAGLPLEQREYEILDAPPPTLEGLYYSFAEMEALVEDALTGGVEDGARSELMGWSRTTWAGEDGGTAPAEPVAAQALLVRSERAAYEDAWIQEVFAPTPIAGELTALLGGDGGYRLEDGVGIWWLPSPTQHYAGADAFYVPLSVADPFAADPSSPRAGTIVSYEWDRYALAVMAIESSPSVADVLVTRSEVLAYDYQTLSALRVTDANGVTSQVVQDPLGRVVAASHWGREMHGGEAVRVGFTELPEDGEWPRPSSLAALVADPAAYLRGAATFSYYDLPDGDGDGPPSVTMVSAAEYPDPAEPDRPRGALSLAITYADGLGRTVQETVNVEPGIGVVTDAEGDPVVGEGGEVEHGELAERWLTSGRVRYNSRGEPFRRFEPFYIGTWRFVTDPSLAEFGVSPTLHYDPLGRPSRMDIPRGPFQDAFFTRVEYGAWEQTSWDADDTILESRYYRYYVDEGHPLPENERAALVSAAAFADTPGTSRFDAFGRPVQEVARLAGGKIVEGGGTMEELVTHRGFLVSGEELWSADPRLFAAGARNFESVYALDGSIVKTISADAGTGWALADVVGRGLVSVDPRGYVFLPGYDSRQRVTSARVRPPEGDPFVAQRTVFGDSLDAEGGTVVDPAARNVLGMPVVAYDEAGAGTTLRYGIGGEALEGEQRLVASYLAAPDWAGAASTWAALFAALDTQLEAERFATTYAWDALGRFTVRTDPAGNRWRETYHVSGRIDTVSIQPPDQAERAYVRGIAYNARGDRERVEYGDPDGALLLTTTFAYDPYDFRLSALRTVRATDSAVLQDLAFWYDPVGNPVIETDAAAPGARVRSAGGASPGRTFRYDSLYRLVASTGRAHAAYTRADLRTGSYAPYFAAPRAHRNDAAATEGYEMAYAYDAGNNLTRTAFVSSSSRWTQTIAVSPTSNRAVEEPESGAAGVPAGAFDAAGNPLYLDAIPAMAWDHRGALAAAVTVEREGADPDGVFCTYRGTGERVRKVWRTAQAGGTVAEVTIYLGPYEIHRTISGGRVTSEYRRLRVMDADRCAVQWLRWTVGDAPGGGSADQHRYQLDDRLGGSVMEVDARGLMLSAEEYAAYGGTTWAAGESLAEVSRKHYRFSGKERDTATGLSYFGARYYAPWLGRWISPDPAGPVDGLNLYEYVASNPASYVDPLGYGKQTAKSKAKKKKSTVPKVIKKPDPAVVAARSDATKLFGRGRKNFYPKLKAMAKAARGGDVNAVAEATKLATRMKTDKAFRKEIAKRVRVRAVKAGGAKKGYGKDELFQTSETAFAFELSSGLVPGVAPTAFFKGPSGKVQEVDLLDAQEHVRLDTSIVPTKEGEGHTGMLRPSITSTGYMTTGQAGFHQERTTVMTGAKSTGEAILNVMARHIHSTANVTTVKAKHNSGFTVTNLDLSKATDKSAFVTQMARVRDQEKMVVEELKGRLFEDSGGTTAVSYTEPPLSPRHDTTYAPSGFKKAQAIDEFGSFFKFGLPTFSSTK